MIDTNEDLLLVTHFFNYLQACYQKSPENIRYVLQFFINHVTASHTGLHSTRKNIENLEKFYYVPSICSCQHVAFTWNRYG